MVSLKDAVTVDLVKVMTQQDWVGPEASAPSRKQGDHFKSRGYGRLLSFGILPFLD